MNNMVWPVYVYLILTLISLGYVIAKHGDNCKINACASVITQGFIWFLLYKGGFFDVLLK